MTQTRTCALWVAVCGSKEIGLRSLRVVDAYVSVRVIPDVKII